VPTLLAPDSTQAGYFQAFALVVGDEAAQVAVGSFLVLVPKVSRTVLRLGRNFLHEAKQVTVRKVLVRGSFRVSFMRFKREIISARMSSERHVPAASGGGVELNASMPLSLGAIRS
jgi:hypothetical protein